MYTFTKLREMIESHKDLKRKTGKLSEATMQQINEPLNLVLCLE